MNQGADGQAHSNANPGTLPAGWRAGRNPEPGTWNLQPRIRSPAQKNASGRVADFHALRHTFITRLARSGVAPAVAKSLARHSGPTLTMDHQTHTLSCSAALWAPERLDVRLSWPRRAFDGNLVRGHDQDCKETGWCGRRSLKLRGSWR